ncbi:hypothetical protein FRC19_008290 [Serendipita sp. 401]|nr:hypothetical protein FRC19_008290 [Serendipita sp. 401]KAG9053613.1 hypothetical protein FS842_007697 [Serendipita sp. 407]
MYKASSRICSPQISSGQVGELAKRATPTKCHPKSSGGKKKRAGVEVCVVEYRGDLIPITGVLIRENKRKKTALYKVTEGCGLPHGKYLVKRGLGEHELSLSRRMSLVIADNNTNNARPPADQCIVMHIIGKDIRNLPSYKTAYGGGKDTCHKWVEARMMVVATAINHFRSTVGDYAHRDLCFDNTRWTSDDHVNFIDYGDACTPAKEGKYDYDDVPMLTTNWKYDLCDGGPEAGKFPPELDAPEIN